MIDKAQIDALRSRINIVDVIGRRVQLKREGGEFVGCCPFHSEKTPSFKVNQNKQMFHCFGCGAGGDVFEFVQKIDGKSFIEVFEDLSGDKIINVPTPTPPLATSTRENKNEFWSALPVLDDTAPPPPEAHYKRGKPAHIAHYKNLEGKTVGYVYRFEGSDGKATLPLTWCEHNENKKREWRWKGFVSPRPLYHSDKLKENKLPILLVEGEKKCDIAQKVLSNYLIMSWCGGSKAVKHTDWNLIPSNSTVYLWADCDNQKGRDGVALPAYKQAGTAAMMEIAARLSMNKIDTRMVEIPTPGEKPSGWDIADCINEGTKTEDINKLILSAKPSNLTAETQTQGGGGGEPPPSLAVIESFAQLMIRYSLIYGKGGIAFDHHDRIILKLDDIKHICGSREVYNTWHYHPDKSIVRVDDVGFDPSEKDGIKCNLWGGFPKQPKHGKCSALIELLYHLCSKEKNKDEIFNWVLKWLAYPLQHPGAKMTTSLVFHGGQGVGKNLFFETYKDIFGRYGLVIGQDQLDDKFNDWASHKMFVVADEVVTRAELYQTKNKLKAMITGNTIQINPKGLASHSEKNCMNFVFLSNEDMPLVLEKDDRRYFVIHTPEKLTPAEYQEVGDEINNGGVEALFQYLLEVDLSGFTPHSPPILTNAKQDLINVSSDSIVLFYDKFVSGEVLPCGTEINSLSGELERIRVMPMLSQQLYSIYRHWCDGVGLRAAPAPRFVNALAKKYSVRAERKRYLDGYYKVGPHSVLLFPGGETPSEKEDEQKWLGFKINEMKENIKKYKGNHA